MFVVAFNLNKMISLRCFCNLNLFCLRFLILHPIFRVSFFSIKKMVLRLLALTAITGKGTERMGKQKWIMSF